VSLSDREDSIRWALSINSQFSTSLYRHCSFSGVVDVRMEELWKSKLPLKIRNFLWLVYRERIQTVDNLKKKRWKGDEKCQFCLESESVDHLLFMCPLAVYVWVVVRDVLGWNALPVGVKNFVENCYGSTSLVCAGENATEEQPWEEIGEGMNSSGTKDYRRHRGDQVCQPR
jgi:hypothetical protein